jgi:hypothetical protein
MTTKIEKTAFNRSEGAAYIGVAENTFVKLINEGKSNVPELEEG